MKHATLLLATLSTWLLTPVAAAQDYATHSPMYIGIKAGQMEADVNGFDESSNIGFNFGFDLFEDADGAFSIEAEYTHKLSEGDVTIAGARGDWKIETLAGYGAYRTAGDVYVKAKAGVLREDVKVSIAGGGLSSEKDTGFSFGAGAGVRFNRKVGLELEYTVVENDVGFLSLGYFTHF